MIEIVQLCGYFAIVFAISMGAAYFLTNLRVKRVIGRPVPNGTLQLRSGNGIYRSKFIGENSSGWVISAPLKRDSYVPIRIGEALTVVCPTDQGLRSFETEVVRRDSDSHELTLQKPVRMFSVERRENNRTNRFLNPNASIEGRTATLLDLSSDGARLITSEPVQKGERAVVDIPNSGRVFGWVLESSPADPGFMVRLRFEEAISVADAHLKAGR